MENNKVISEELMQKIVSDRMVRTEITKQSHFMFFHVYFPHYVKYPLAEFHKDMFRITEDQSNKLACIVAFRGSAKSTLVTFSYPLWAILGVQQKRFVLIICQTQAQARQQMSNIKYELEHNPLLKSDLGPFREDFGSGDWAISSLVFQNTGARITIASIDQSIRGIRHQENRPDLIILDDIEDLNSTKTMEGRDKIFDWFTREVVPLGDIGTRIIVVGNLLHEDSLMMRLRRRIEKNQLKGIFKWFPLLTDDGECLWPGKFDTKEKIEELRQSVANEVAWQQEYLLKIVSDTSRVIFPGWIQYHDLKSTDDFREQGNICGGFMGVDLAISQSERADYTAIVSGVICRYEGKMRLLVFPNPINRRLSYYETLPIIRGLAKQLHFDRCFADPTIGIETNGFQEIYADQLKGSGLNVKGIKNTTNKRTRLALISAYIQDGTILFPKVGSEELVLQLTGFGYENHDDLSDSLVMLILAAGEELHKTFQFDAWSSFTDTNNGFIPDFP